MRKVLEKKRKYGYRDFLYIFSVYLMHFIGFLIYGLIILSLKSNKDGNVLFSLFAEVTDYRDFGMIYVFSIAPLLNGTMQLIYTQLGKPWYRGIMYWHTIGLIIALPLMLTL